MAVRTFRFNIKITEFSHFFPTIRIRYRINNFLSPFTGIRERINSFKEGYFPFFHVIIFLNASTTSVGTRVTFVLDKMPPRRRSANEVPVEEAYKCDRMTRLKQHMEALTQQFQVFLAVQNQQNQPQYDSSDEG